MSIFQTLFTVIWFYYIFTVIPLSIIGLIIGIYQVCKPYKYNMQNSLIWLAIAVSIIIIARIFRLVYYPEFGCDESTNDIDTNQFILTFTYGLIGSMLIYIFPIFRLFKKAKKN
jgi:Na+/H+-dicarboxylate symporter